MITSIQIHENVKNELDRLKEGRQTYEEVIINIIKLIEQQKRGQKALLIEGYKEMAQESLKITKEFEPLEKELDWEWKPQK
jgi:predicted CopG family antitoxin